jgi:hypothetical protein
MTTLVIKYPNGATQVVKPNMAMFKGDWNGLTQAIGGQYFPRDIKGVSRVNYEVK